MAFVYIQSASNTASATSVAATCIATGSNNLIVVNLRFNVAGGVSGLSVTDSAGNTYALAAGPITPDSTVYVYQFYAVQTTGGVTSVTASWTTAASARIIIDEFSGGALSNAAIFDVASSGSGAAGASGSVTSFSPAVAGELIVVGLGTFAGEGTPTAGAGYTLGTSTNASISEYKLSGGASETAPISWVNSTNWAEIAGAYKAASAGAPQEFLMYMKTGY